MRSFRHVFGMIKLSDEHCAGAQPRRGRTGTATATGRGLKPRQPGCCRPLVVLLPRHPIPMESLLPEAYSNYGGPVPSYAVRIGTSPKGAAVAVGGPGVTPYGGHAGSVASVASVAYAPDGARPGHRRRGRRPDLGCPHRAATAAAHRPHE